MADKTIQLKSETGDKLNPKSWSRNILDEFTGLTVYDTLRALENEAWQNLTLINGFVPYATGEKVQYKKKANTIYLRGTLKSGTLTKPFVLPVGARPDQVIRCGYLTSTGHGYCSIEPDGVVTLTNYSTGMSFVSIDNITFAL